MIHNTTEIRFSWLLRIVTLSTFLSLLASLFCCSSLQKPVSSQMTQFPSPMVEYTRMHKKIPEEEIPGTNIMLDDILTKPVEIYIPTGRGVINFKILLIHFHGSSYIPKYAVYYSESPLILATVNLGIGSSVYEKAFIDPSAFDILIKSIQKSVTGKGLSHQEFSEIYLSSFSAGYGSVRAILRNHQSRINGLILLDGLHTNYIPEGKVLYDGGILNTDNLGDFLTYASLAVKGQKRFLITHSEIFPGMYASTTETADYILSSLGLKRNPVLKWGPGGMQLLSETTSHGLTILGFAGNTAPDHIDHFNGLPVFLKMILSNNEQ